MNRTAVRRFLACSILFIAASAFAQRPLRMAGDAGNCAAVTLSCDAVANGVLESGDCTNSEGKRYDVYFLNMPADRDVEVSIRSAATGGLTNPALFVDAPSGAAQVPPSVGSGSAAVVAFRTIAAGTWSVAVSSDDAFAQGAYVLTVTCRARSAGGLECVQQELLCGNVAYGRISPESCIFNNVTRGYESWRIYGRAGDAFTLKMTSFDFQPVMGVYDNSGLLQSSIAANSYTSNLTFIVQKTGWYYVLATSTVNGEIGDYTLELSCFNSGCLQPVLTQPIGDIRAPIGSSPSLDLKVSYAGPLTVSLYEDLSTVTTGSSTHLDLPAVTTAPHAYHVQLSTPCGSSESNTFLVMPDRRPKLRSVRH
ncbi:MAG TPA: hypothetical protein VFN10_07570 [Thermoanaerobaculia bacterium]|nr:hypothetical protein [Thermoanaerobaculia bacterium]